MVDWLSDALENGGTVVTANRRLARVLSDEFAVTALSNGKTAWRSPSIASWPGWLQSLVDASADQSGLAIRINAHQSRLLWERCLKKDVGAQGIGVSNLVRLSRDAWQQLADWRISISDLARSAQNDDQRLFASIAGRYLGVLEREHWVDDAGLGELVLTLIAKGQVPTSAHYTFAGFEQAHPMVAAIQGALKKSGVNVQVAPAPILNRRRLFQAFDNRDAELRAAGAWARAEIDSNPSARVAIIAKGLEQQAEAIARPVREGMTPGWQYAHPMLSSALNVSYGQRLSDYPAVSTGLLLLRWLVDDLPSTDVSRLLRSPLLGAGAMAGRARLELQLRQLPDRRWSPSMLTSEFRGSEDNSSSSDPAAAAPAGDATTRSEEQSAGGWLKQLAAFAKRRRELPRQAAPAEWVSVFDDVLAAFSWPGQGRLSSDDFQLVNRWRELLNEFARLGLVSSAMGPATAVRRLELMTGETVFQAESAGAAVQLLGPLEASGLWFDRVWITGLSSNHWPPAGTPSRLVSRRLQEEHGMPDCTPANTSAYAKQLLTGLVGASETVVCSYALTEDDAEQTASDLLLPLELSETTAMTDPGLHATVLMDTAEARHTSDVVPGVAAGEKISGGAGTLQRQINDPFAAFSHGRLGVRTIYPQAVGISAQMRGNLVHDALYRLYIDLPDSDAIRHWQGDSFSKRIDTAVNGAISRHERNADAVLLRLLELERLRLSQLIRQFVAVDGRRGDFTVASVEGKFEFVAGDIRLPLRFDRIDRFDDGSIAILDYKTGAKKRLLNRKHQAQEIQLFVYAAAADSEVSALALVNVDRREIGFDGAGRGYTDEAAWAELLAGVTNDIETACRRFAAGDVSINREQGVAAARPLNLLSRFSELTRGNG